jgi:hypothetical protein
MLLKTNVISQLKKVNCCFCLSPYLIKFQLPLRVIHYTLSNNRSSSQPHNEAALPEDNFFRYLFFKHPSIIIELAMEFQIIGCKYNKKTTPRIANTIFNFCRYLWVILLILFVKKLLFTFNSALLQDISPSLRNELAVQYFIRLHKAGAILTNIHFIELIQMCSFLKGPDAATMVVN